MSSPLGHLGVGAVADAELQRDARPACRQARAPTRARRARSAAAAAAAAGARAGRAGRSRLGLPSPGGRKRSAAFGTWSTPSFWSMMIRTLAGHAGQETLLGILGASPPRRR